MAAILSLVCRRRLSSHRERTRGAAMFWAVSEDSTTAKGFWQTQPPQYWPPRGGALCGLNHKYSTTPIWLIFVTWPVRTANNQRLTEKNPPRTWKQICWLICVGQQFCFVMFLFLGKSVYCNRQFVVFLLCAFGYYQFSCRRSREKTTEEQTPAVSWLQ